jgi:colanic acid biosynthesis glycosyl transferase WcaI
MRVLILSIYHDPEPIPKTGELARELKRRGHEVQVVTAFPHYPSGRLYDGYSLALWRRERRDGIDVLRTFIYPYHGRNAFLRTVNYITWMFSSMMAAWLTPPCDVIYVWHPPLTVGVTAWIVSTLKRVPFVYDVQDLWPQSAIASGMLHPGVIVDGLHKLANWVYRKAPRILVVSDAAATQIAECGVAIEKVIVAPHWIDLSLFQVNPDRDVRAELGCQNKFVVMFAGNLGMVQGLETVVEAAALMRDCPDLMFVFVGDGSDRVRLEALAAQRSLTNLRFIGQQPVTAMADYMRAADALIVHLRPSEIAEHAIPTKILSYLAASRPIVCATGGASADLVQQAAAGVIATAGDPASIAAAIREVIAMPPAVREQLGRNGRRHLLEHFEKGRVIDIYERVLRDVIPKPAAPMAGPADVKLH